jgi:glycosyltransferase involved in cell wall biosynthesis
LEENADVASQKLNPLHHYIQRGASEKRAIHPLTTSAPEGQPKRDYDAWVKQYDTITQEDKVAIGIHIANFTQCPLISVVMPVYNTNPVFLRKAIDSVLAQIYPNWELCIADDASPDPLVREVLEEYARRDQRIKVVFRAQNGYISAASNSALALAAGGFVALMDHDDELAIHALYMVAAELNDHPDADIVYSDEDKIDAEGRRHGPYFKSDWNPELFYSQNMVNHLGVLRTALVRQVGGFREGFEGSQDYDLVLRLVNLTKPQRIRHIPFILYHWRLGEGMTTFSTNRNDEAVAAARRALSEHFAARGEKVQVIASRVPYWHRIERFVPDSIPRVSLVVMAGNHLHLLRNCLEGLLNGTDCC